MHKHYYSKRKIRQHRMNEIQSASQKHYNVSVFHCNVWERGGKQISNFITPPAKVHWNIQWHRHIICYSNMIRTTKKIGLMIWKGNKGITARIATLITFPRFVVKMKVMSIGRTKQTLTEPSNTHIGFKIRTKVDGFKKLDCSSCSIGNENWWRIWCVKSSWSSLENILLNESQSSSWKAARDSISSLVNWEALGGEGLFSAISLWSS